MQPQGIEALLRAEHPDAIPPSPQFSLRYNPAHDTLTILIVFVQMYIRDCYSSVTRPVKELKGFQRIPLQPGQTKTVTFDITPDLLSFYDINMKFGVEPGEFEIMIGNFTPTNKFEYGDPNEQPDH